MEIKNIYVEKVNKIRYNVLCMVKEMEEYIKNIDLQVVSMQTLAFIGDAVYNVYVRCHLAASSTEKTGKLHKKSIQFVSAKAQSKLVDMLIQRVLSEEEIAIYKRGRNTNINKVTKNVDVVEYKKATGFETLIGYLYVNHENERLDLIIKMCIDYIVNNES